jgi:parallel beta-helix repeat protein
VERHRGVESLEPRLLMAVFTVTNTDDSGVGSLRDALTRSNNTAGVDTIAFNIGSASKLIRPSSPLPELWDPGILDATTQPGYAGKPLVQIDGANAGASATGLKLWGGSTAKGLSITNFALDGVDLNNRGGFAGNVLQGTWVGLDLAGNAAGNAGQGVLVWKSANNLIGGPNPSDRNVIAAAKTRGTLGLLIMGGAATNNLVQNNYIGTDPTGTQARANAGSGVGIQDAPNNRILGNLISGNVEDGVLIFKSLATGNVVQGNRVGVDATGTRALANGFYGIEIQTANNTIGGAAQTERNVFSGNAKAGVVLWTTAATANTIQGNYIGTDAAGSAKLPTAEQGVAVSNANGNTIKSNLISGNTLEAVGIFPGSSNTVTGNTIGFSASGMNLPNGTWAVTLVGGSNANVVTGNYIAPHPKTWFQDSGVNSTGGNFSTLPALPGDANRDGVVNFNDLLALAKNYNATDKTWAEGDFNGDGVVNFNDLLLLAQRYGSPQGTASTAAVFAAVTSGTLAPSQPAPAATPIAPASHDRPAPGKVARPSLPARRPGTPFSGK